MRPEVYNGHLLHDRLRPTEHRFDYDVSFWSIPLNALASHPYPDPAFRVQSGPALLPSRSGLPNAGSF